MIRERNLWKDFDWAMLALALAICALGLVQINSATRGTPLAGLHWKQLAWIVVGLAAMVLVSRIDYHSFLEQAPIIYLLALLALFGVLLLGHKKFGARRWMDIAGQTIQVSEVVKIVIIIALARYFSELRTERLTLMDLAKIGVLAGLPTGLILLQPDLGTALVLIALTGVGVFLAGIEWKHAVAIILLGALLLPVGWHFMKPYQKQRIQAFLDPEETARSSGYQTLQSKIAVGSGGVWGKGFNQGSQNQLGYVPVRWADFILAGLAEEQGFAGVLVALLLYMGLLLRLVGTAQLASDRAGMFLVMGVAAVLGFHVLVNTAMVIGYVPVTGIPLPLMSHGASATLFVFLALGLATNVRLRRFVN
jgi:rod shape determining protein RodA